MQNSSLLSGETSPERGKKREGEWDATPQTEPDQLSESVQETILSAGVELVTSTSTLHEEAKRRLVEIGDNGGEEVAERPSVALHRLPVKHPHDNLVQGVCSLGNRHRKAAGRQARQLEKTSLCDSPALQVVRGKQRVHDNLRRGRVRFPLS